MDTPTIQDYLKMLAEDFPEISVEATSLVRFLSAHEYGVAQAERIHAAGLAVAEHNRTHPRAQRRSYRRGLPADTIDC